MGAACLQGKEAVPEAVDHVLVLVDPRVDRLMGAGCLQGKEAVPEAVDHVLVPVDPRVDRLMGAGRLQGKEAVPEAVDHVLVPVDPREDRSWLQSEPAVATDNAHRHDSTGPHVDSAANWSEAAKRLKPRILQRLIDAHKCGACLLPAWHRRWAVPQAGHGRV